jgi:DNA-binding NtrC family response regulator
MDKVILFVDDNQSLAGFTGRIMRGLRPSWHIIAAGSCAEARKVTDNTLPGAAVVDLSLPDGNGLDLLFELQVKHPDLPVVLISASVSERLKDEVKHRGGFAVVEKPFEVGALVEVVERGLAEYEAKAVGADQRSSVAAESFSPWTASPDRRLDFHRAQNRLSTLIAGLRAMEAEVKLAGGAQEVARVAEDYVDKLCNLVKEVSLMLNEAGRGATRHSMNEGAGKAAGRETSL